MCGNVVPMKQWRKEDWLRLFIHWYKLFKKGDISVNRKVLILIIVAISISILAGCEKATSTQTTQQNGQSSFISSSTKISVSKSSSTSTDSAVDGQNPDAILALKAYKKVLQNEAEFFSTDEKKFIYLNKFNYFNGSNFEGLKVMHFTVIDMDGDKIPEIVLELTIVNSVESNPAGTEVLHYEDGKVYGYNFVYRALYSIKTDGTFNFSSGAADNGYGKLRFLSNTSEIDNLGYCESSGYKNGILKVSYFINNEPVTKESYDLFCEKQNGKDDIVWFEFTQQNIEKQLSINSWFLY